MMVFACITHAFCTYSRSTVTINTFAYSQAFVDFNRYGMHTVDIMARVSTNLFMVFGLSGLCEHVRVLQMGLFFACLFIFNDYISIFFERVQLFEIYTCVHVSSV
jgi:hypothetical protein